MLKRSRKVVNLEAINFSIILLNMDRSDIGLKLLISSASPPLWIGITLAILFLSGKIPSLKEELQISISGIEISFLEIFISLIGIEQGPDDLESSNELIILIISCLFVGEIKKEVGNLFKVDEFFIRSLRFRNVFI